MASSDVSSRLSNRQTPGDTLDDLPTVDTSLILKPVGATITPDEDPLPAPSATQLRYPVKEVLLLQG